MIRWGESVWILWAERFALHGVKNGGEAELDFCRYTKFIWHLLGKDVLFSSKTRHFSEIGFCSGWVSPMSAKPLRKT
jgi:hypothetical protein